jgi:hypothetical protein
LREHALGLLVGLLLASCSASASSGTRPDTTRAADKGVIARRLLEHACLDCHLDTDGSRPDFGQLDSAKAFAAVQAVLGRRMPPTSATAISDGERAALASWLCQKTDRDPAYCDRVVERSLHRQLQRSGTTLLTAFRRITPNAERSHFIGQLIEHMRIQTTSANLDATSLVLILGLATQACKKLDAKPAPAPGSGGGPPPPPPADEEPPRAEPPPDCLAKFLDAGTAPPKPPAP